MTRKKRTAVFWCIWIPISSGLRRKSSNLTFHGLNFKAERSKGARSLPIRSIAWSMRPSPKRVNPKGKILLPKLLGKRLPPSPRRSPRLRKERVLKGGQGTFFRCPEASRSVRQGTGDLRLQGQLRWRLISCAAFDVTA